jgi:GNAT superfamily N-acetyltransferase
LLFRAGSTAKKEVEMKFKDNRLEVTFTYLEMHNAPIRPQILPPVLKYPVKLTRIMEPTVGFYRYLYNAVGEPWLWYERRIMEDEPLIQIIHDERVEIYCLFVGSVPAGYAELNRRDRLDIELSYFGLIPDFIGKGLGRYFLEAVIDIAWSHNPNRFWLHTCTLDHPSALPNYQRRGFSMSNQITRKVMDPRQVGYLPVSVGPPLVV